MSLMVNVSLPACPVGRFHCFTVSVLEGLGAKGFVVQVVPVFVGLLGSVDVGLTSSFGIEASILLIFGQNFRKSFFVGSSHAFFIMSSNCLEHSVLFHIQITNGQFFSILIV
jgi:hypothetical protein